MRFFAFRILRGRKCERRFILARTIREKEARTLKTRVVTTVNVEVAVAARRLVKDPVWLETELCYYFLHMLFDCTSRHSLPVRHGCYRLPVGKIADERTRRAVAGLDEWPNRARHADEPGSALSRLV